jgi:hypothetical protein
VIINELPPNFEQIKAAFPNADQPGVLFAFDGNVYNPSGIVIPPALIAHEEVHLYRQRSLSFGFGRQSVEVGRCTPERWWQEYIDNSEFRYREELLAHVAEFKHQKHGDRNASARLLMATALRLVAPLYNYVPPVSLQQAMKDLRREISK